MLLFQEVFFNIKRICHEIRERVIALHKENYNTVEIGKKLGISDASVGRILKQNNLQVSRDKITVRKSVINELIRLYDENYNITELSKMFNLSIYKIKTLFKKNNKSMDRRKKTNIKNHNYFSEIDNEVKAYFLGLIISDGCIKEPSPLQLQKYDFNKSLTLGLRDYDKDILYKLSDELKGNNKLIRFARQMCIISFASKQICSDLSKYGVVPRKSFKTYLPQINDDYMYALIRGIFDGDGSVSLYQNTISIKIVGTETLCYQIRDYLYEKLRMSKNKIIKDRSVFIVKYSKNADIIKFYNYIYKNTEFYLKRKKDRFEKYLKLGNKGEKHEHNEIHLSTQ